MTLGELNDYIYRELFNRYQFDPGFDLDDCLILIVEPITTGDFLDDPKQRVLPIEFSPGKLEIEDDGGNRYIKIDTATGVPYCSIGCTDYLIYVNPEVFYYRGWLLDNKTKKFESYLEDAVNKAYSSWTKPASESLEDVANWFLSYLNINNEDDN